MTEAETPRGDLPALPHGGKLLFSALISAATPETDLTVSEHADRYRVVSDESGSPYPGPWRTDRVPYLREPTDCLHSDHPARRVTLKFSAQTGKTEIGVNWFCFIVDAAPASTMIVMPTGDEAIKYNRVKLQPTIDASPRIRHRVKAENSRDEKASTNTFKRFAGGSCIVVNAGSSKGLQMVSIRWLILDEVSGYLRDVDGRGSPSAQARARQKSYGDLAKELAISTPGMAGECEISDLYEASDRRRYYVPCPHCGTFGRFKYENMQEPCASTGWRATFACQACGGVIDQADRAGMIAAGRWIPTWVGDGEEPIPDVAPASEVERLAIAPCAGRVSARQPGYALWAAYSPMESWTDIWLRGQASRGDPVKEKVFTQQDLGEPFEPKTDTPDWEKLLAVRAAWKQGVAPWPAAVLTGFIDVQGNRFEWGVWGWGEGFQGWLVDRGVISLDYTDDAAWAALDALTARRWPTAGGREIGVLQWGIDTGTYSQTLYDRVSRRHALLATKGGNRPRDVPLKKTRADLRDARGRPIAGRRIDLGLIGNYDLKSSVYEGLRSLVAGPDADGRWRPSTLHLPDWIGEDELRQLTAEMLVDPADYKPGKARRGALVKPGVHREWRKRHEHAPNEALDIVVGCRALAWGESAGHIDAARWRELATEAHGPKPSEPDLFHAASLAPKPAPAPAKRAESVDEALERLGKLNEARW